MADVPCPHCGRDIPVFFEPPRECLHCTAELTVLDGAYRIEGMLGRGGQGVVYDGRRASDGQRVAIKMLRVADTVDWKNTELFERSARVLQGLDHRGVPRVFDVREDEENGAFFLIRETFTSTLEERILEQHRRLDTRDFHALFVRMLRILEYLHSLIPQVLHRDIKPSNIMFRSEEDWEPVLVDFGTVAAAVSGGTMVGTPGYSAPEQFIGDFEPASDLYSLGVTMLFVATHCPPGDLSRKGGEFDVADRLGGLGARSRKVLLKLVRSERKARYQSASQALADLNPPRSQSPEPPAETPSTPRGALLALRNQRNTLPAQRERPKNALVRIKREGWIAQLPSEARGWAKVGFVVAFFTMFPVSLFLVALYMAWRRTDSK